MTGLPASRRVFLAALAALAAVGRARRAGALSLRDDPAAERLYNATCESRAVHDRRMEDLIREIESRADEVTPELHNKVAADVAAMRCPVCGCKLGPLDPYPAKF